MTMQMGHPIWLVLDLSRIKNDSTQIFNKPKIQKSQPNLETLYYS